MLHCKFSGDYDGERIFKIGQYLTKLCVQHLGFTFLAHPVLFVPSGIGFWLEKSASEMSELEFFYLSV